MKPALTSAARQIEAQLEQPVTNSLQAFVRDEATRAIEAQNLALSNYDLYAVRRNPQMGEEVVGPTPILVGNYSEAQLYGAVGSEIARFRASLRALASTAEKAVASDTDDVEYGYAVSLFWADASTLKDYLGATALISELVAILRTARFQFLGKDTPPEFMRAMAEALRLAGEARRFDEALVDRFVETLEAGGFDLFVVDTLRGARD